MTPFILHFDTISAANLAKVGGKGANLGELTRAGFSVPPGFCVTTAAFWQFMAEAPPDLYAALENIAPDDIERLRQVGNEVRTRLQQIPLPGEVADAVVQAWHEIGPEYAYAVRSSATAEDLPYASFAGQHDTYLNIRGKEALLASVKACFVSLFTNRAILYRMQNGFDHRKVALAVVVQRMVQPEVAGILFTADPVSGNRHVASIDASFGLGEALVSGLVSADLYQVDKRTGRILKRQIASKQMAIRPLAEGGTEQVELAKDARTRPALTDTQAIELARLGSQIEAHFGAPQDIEWALADGVFYITQSRPITSLYPLPQPRPEDDAVHVYASISHVEVMTDAMPPLALSLLRTVLPVGHSSGEIESKYVVTAGGRLYGDISPLLRHPVGRRFIFRLFENADPLTGQALAVLADRPSFVSHGERFNPLRLLPAALPILPQVLSSLLWKNTKNVTEQALATIDTHLATVEARLDAACDLREKLAVAVAEMHRILVPVLTWAPDLAAGLAATVVLHALLSKRADAGDLVTLERGLVGNIETEMTLAVSDLADAARASKELLAYLSQTHLEVKTRLAHVTDFPGGDAFLQAWNRFMALYGARGPAEIDLSRPRWSEDPASLLQMVLNATKASEPGAHRAHYGRLIAEAEMTAETVIGKAKKGWWGWLRSPLTRRLISVSRNLMPLRGHHKFLAVRLLASIKPILLQAGKSLEGKGRLETARDIWFLTLPEILEALDKPEQNLKTMVRERRSEFEHNQSLTPPRVITSDGEIPFVKLDGGEAPEGALIGNPVSAGVVEGAARVILDPGVEALNPGEILVAPFTDPGWTPLFVNAAGLVMEVGGLMTHGSVVAREYGIPAVVGVIGATKKIKTGQRIRVHGGAGYVELLDEEV